MSSTLPLPAPFRDIPRTPLLYGPSPIHPLPRISADLSPTGTVKLWAKREDSNSALAFGGNKTRKLEYLLADALAAGADTLVSIGGVQSNHTRQVAAVAARYGLKAKLVQEHWVDWADPAYTKAGNLQLSRLMGADVTLDPSPFGIAHKPTLAAAVAAIEAAGGKPYAIPAGASDHPLGGLGFARWAFEVAAQEREMGVFFSTVVVCAVTGSTLAGMVAGFKLLEAQPGQEHTRGKRRVVGIDASADPAATKAQVLKIARQTAQRIGLPPDSIADADIELDPRYHAGVYGVPDAQTVEAIRYGARMEAFLTDPVYEGKSLAGLLDMVRRGEMGEGDCLYVHLGGQMVLGVYEGMEEVVGLGFGS